MKIIDSLDKLNNIEKGWVLSIGNFDGLHIGHKQILSAAKEVCDDIGAAGVAVMTFDPHPVKVLRPEHAPGVLTPIGLKSHLLEAEGIDCLIVVKDSYKLLNLSPEEFVSEFLMKTVKPRVVVEGSDFNFGYGRSGNIDTLREIGLERGFDVIGVDLKTMLFSQGEHERVSSSILRDFIERGRMVDVCKALGREYRLIGESVPGRGVGRQLGYPTANMDPINQILPGEGVYAGYLQIGDCREDVEVIQKRLPAIFSVGRVKTFVTDHPLLFEAHVLTGDEDVAELYGKWLAMDFKVKVRNQRVFASPEELRRQIDIDCGKAEEMLGL